MLVNFVIILQVLATAAGVSDFPTVPASHRGASGTALGALGYGHFLTGLGINPALLKFLRVVSAAILGVRPLVGLKILLDNNGARAAVMTL